MYELQNEYGWQSIIKIFGNNGQQKYCITRLLTGEIKLKVAY